MNLTIVYTLLTQKHRRSISHQGYSHHLTCLLHLSYRYNTGSVIKDIVTHQSLLSQTFTEMQLTFLNFSIKSFSSR